MLTLVSDTSAYGVGVVLVHKMWDSSEKPMGHASRTLAKSECIYCQLAGVLIPSGNQENLEKELRFFLSRKTQGI